MNVYWERSAVVAALVSAAEAKGWETCQWVDADEGSTWPVICIELPTGQVTWHVALDDAESLGLTRLKVVDPRWDGHSTKEKYQRLGKCDWRDHE